jgi:heme oxygenase
LLGVLYVIEGSSLGGQLILKELQQRHGLTTETGARFFTGYGERISAQWRSFGDAVNTLVCAHDSRYTLDSAKAMFRIFGDWMQTPDGAAT